MVSKQKKQIVNELTQMLKDYPIVGVVNMQSLPAPQLQSLRSALRGKVELRMARRRILQRALEQGEKGKELIEHLKGMPALLFTKDNPFSLYKIIKKNKSSAPAKAGQMAPGDIVVQAGPTPFAPGPVIGELGAIGLKTGVENGKVAIKADSVVCKEGDEIKPKVADVLKRLGIKPMEIGLNIVAVVENGVVFKAAQLDIDEDAFNAQLLDAISSARNLAVDICYPAADVVELLVQKAFREAKAVALEAGIFSKDTINEILGKGERAAAALQAAVEEK
jgi:large subunit ribosomal protein L10